MNSGWFSALRRLGVDLRPREAPQVLVLFTYSFLLGIFQFSSKAVRQATYVDALGAEQLPWVYLAVALAAYPTLRLYSHLSGRWSSGRVISATVIGAGVVSVIFWWLLAEPTVAVSFAYYLWIAIAIALTLSQLWSYVNSVLDARQARRLFAFISAGGLLGGVLGGQVASLASLSEPRNALLVGAVVLFAIGALVRWSESTGRSQSVSLGSWEERPEGERAEAVSTGARSSRVKRDSGLSAIRRSAHLRLIAAIMVLTVVVAEVIDLQFNWVIEQFTTGLDQRTALFGNLFSLMGLAAFLFQLAITGRIHRTFGVGVAMRVLPLFVIGTSVLVGGAVLLAPVTLVYLISFLKVGDNGLRYSLDHATRELLFVPVRPSERLLAKSYIDVLVQRSAKGIGAVLLLTVTFGWVSVLQATWFSLVFGGVWLACTTVAHRHYLESLRSGLVPDAVDSDGIHGGPLIDFEDASTLEVLIESLGSAEPERVLGSVDLLASNRRAHLVPPLLLHHDDPRVRRRTLEVLTQADRRDAMPLIERLIGDSEQDVRAAAIQATATLSGRAGTQLMEPRLTDPDPRVRAAAIGCLADQGDEDERELAKKALLHLLSDGDPEVRAEAAKALSLVREPVFQQHLVTLLYDRESKVVLAAIAAVRERAAEHHNPLYVPILISLLRDRRLKHEARETLVSYGESVLPALAHFMNDRSEFKWVRRALPKTIARFASGSASATLFEGLDRCSDPFLRRKVIEALVDCSNGCSVERVDRLVVEECWRYLKTLVALVGVSDRQDYLLRGALWEWRGFDPSLLQRLLEERRQDQLRNVRRLFSLAYSDDIDRAWSGLLSLDRTTRGQALEYLDNVLSGTTRRAVMAVVDDLRLDERLDQCEKHFGIRARSRVDTVRELVEKIPPGDDSAPWLAAAAVQLVCEQRIGALIDDLPRWARESEDELVRETAGWAAARV